TAHCTSCPRPRRPSASNWRSWPGGSSTRCCTIRSARCARPRATGPGPSDICTRWRNCSTSKRNPRSRRAAAIRRAIRRAIRSAISKAMSKRTIEYRRAGTPDPSAPPALWRQRRTMLIAAAIALLILVIAFAGPSWGIAVGKLAVEGVFLLLWLAAAAGYGKVVLLSVGATSASPFPAEGGALVPPGILWGDEPHGYDVLEYHLQLPREWYELHRIVPLHHNVFSYFPTAMEMHYLLAMQLRHGPWAGAYLAQLMHVSVCALSVLAVYAAARTFAEKPPAILAAIAMANVPWVWLLAPVGYNEGALILFTTLALAWLFCRGDACVAGGAAANSSTLRVDRDAGIAPTRRNHWLLAGVMAGFACGVKLTAVPQVL